MNNLKLTAKCLASIILIFCFAVVAFAQQDIKLSETPNGLFERMTNYGPVKNQKGEGFCWYARGDMDLYIENYKLTGNTEWLDAGVKYYDFLIGKMDTGPDGYKGWIGPYMYDQKVWIDSHVGDALLLTAILDFSVLVNENKELQKRYGEKANSYVEIAKKDLIEKCDKRDTWREDGPIGGYTSFFRYMEPGNFKEWKYGKEINESELSHPFNKQGDMALACIRLYKLTHDKMYRDKAERIFLRMKRQLQLNDDHYEWNYWEPLGIWDYDFNKKKLNLWVGINPSVGYQEREVSMMVDAYNNGVVFDETDIKRLINTHLKVMWNKDREKPAFTNSNVLHKPDQREKEKKPTGTLWTSLIDFDQTIRDLYEVHLKKASPNSTEYQYYYKFTAKNPVSFQRKYVKEPVKVPQVKFSRCKEIRMVGVLNSVITPGVKTVLVDFAWKSGDLDIDLYSANGKRKICALFHGIKGTDNLIEWDGTDPAKKVSLRDDYRVRWTLDGEYREFPVTIK